MKDGYVQSNTPYTNLLKNWKVFITLLSKKKDKKVEEVTRRHSVVPTESLQPFSMTLTIVPEKRRRSEGNPTHVRRETKITEHRFRVDPVLKRPSSRPISG